MVRRSKSGTGSLLFRLLAYLFVFSALWFVGLIVFAENVQQEVKDTETRTDAIIVLTGGSGRLEEGLQLLNDNKADKLFVSGVFPGMDVDRLLKLIQQDPTGLKNRIGIGNAIDTFDNAKESALWVQEKKVSSIRLVTSAYHMPRAYLEFSEQLPGVKVIPHPVFSENVKLQEWWAWPGTALLIGGEYTKFLLAWLRHRIRHLAKVAVSQQG